MEEIVLKVLGVWAATVLVVLYYCFEYSRELDS